MFMIELKFNCCGENEISTHQSSVKPSSNDKVYGYCPNCSVEHSDTINNCNVYPEGV